MQYSYGDKGETMEDSGKIMAAAIIAAGIVLGLFLVSQGLKLSPNVYVSNSPTENAISVSATTTQKVSPDLLQLQIRVETEANNARTAQSDNARVMADLKAKLLANGVRESEIQTTSYNVQPVYESVQTCQPVPYATAPSTSGSPRDAVVEPAAPMPYAPDYYPPCKWESVITGYRATHALSVQTDQLQKGGDIIDVAATAGTNQTFVDYVSYTLKDSTRDEFQRNLLKNASAAARAKAMKVAEGLGVSLGKVLSATESSNFYYPSPMYLSRSMDVAAAAPAPTQLSPGQIDVSAVVSVSYGVGN